MANTQSSTDIISYLNEKNILWFPCNVNVVQDKTKDQYGNPKFKKEPKHTMDYMPKPNDFVLLDENEIKRRQQFVDECEYLWIDTRRIVQIDIDKPLERVHIDIKNMSEVCPNYPSITKGTPKIFVEIYEHKDTRNKVKCFDEDVEILCGQPSWCKKDAVVSNISTSIPKIPIEVLMGENRKQNVNHEEQNFKAKYSIDDVRKLLDIMLENKKYVDEHYYWFRVGASLFNILGDNDDALNLFDEWSSESVKYGGVQELWKSLRYAPMKNFTIGTLRHYARSADAKQYKEWVSSVNSKLIYNIYYKGEDFSDRNHARCLKWLLNNRIVTCREKRSTDYYVFKNHRWVKKTHDGDLINMINKELRDLMFDKYQDYNRTAEKYMREDDDETAGKFSAQAKKVQDQFRKLGNAKPKNGILKELETLIMKEPKEFIDFIDEQRHLIGFENGVFDLNENEFRPAKPSDMITKSTNYDYTDKVDENIRQEILNFFTSIMDGEEMCEYLLKTLAYQLHGNKYLERIYYWTGVGSNGKSVLGDLCKYTFGEYYYKPDVKMITTQKQNASTQTEYLLKTKGTRFVFMTEPDEGEKMQSSLMKEWSGNDDIQTRGLYESSVEFKPQFAMQIAMNEKCDLSGTDSNGVARRLRIIPFRFKFCEDPRPDTDDRQIDTTLKEKFKDNRYCQQFMLILLDYYHKFVYGNQNILDPPQVLDESKEYMNDQDNIEHFLNTTCEFSPDYRVGRSDLFNHFKQSSFYDGKSNRSFFKKIRNRKDITSLKSGIDRFVGLRIKEETEEDELENGFTD